MDASIAIASRDGRRRQRANTFVNGFSVRKRPIDDMSASPDPAVVQVAILSPTGPGDEVQRESSQKKSDPGSFGDLLWLTDRETCIVQRPLEFAGARVAELILPGAATQLDRRAFMARLRLVVFVAVAVFIIGGPAAIQIFGVRTTIFRSWIMFSAPGLGVIDASFARLQADGTLLPLDRFAMLDAARDSKIRRIESRDELASIAGRLCETAGPAADIRVVARQATRSGWRVIEEGTASVCSR